MKRMCGNMKQEIKAHRGIMGRYQVGLDLART